jgi:hypothetical protein
MSFGQVYINRPAALSALRDSADDLWTLGACVPLVAGAGLFLLTQIAARSLLRPGSMSAGVDPASDAAR